jgi:hypothetical protein
MAFCGLFSTVDVSSDSIRKALEMTGVKSRAPSPEGAARYERMGRAERHPPESIRGKL